MHQHTFISPTVRWPILPLLAFETCTFILFVLYYALILKLPLFFVPIHQIQIMHYIRTYTLLGLFFHIKSL